MNEHGGVEVKQPTRNQYLDEVNHELVVVAKLVRRRAQRKLRAHSAKFDPRLKRHKKIAELFGTLETAVMAA